MYVCVRQNVRLHVGILFSARNSGTIQLTPPPRITTCKNQPLPPTTAPHTHPRAGARPEAARVGQGPRGGGGGRSQQPGRMGAGLHAAWGHHSLRAGEGERWRGDGGGGKGGGCLRVQGQGEESKLLNFLMLGWHVMSDVSCSLHLISQEKDEDQDSN